MKPQHSPTPWKVVGDVFPKLGIDDKDGKVVVWATEGKIEGLKKHEDAAFIVQACNAHEALVQAIKDVLNTASECDLCSGSGKGSPILPPDEACHACGGTGKILLAEGEIGTMEAALKLAGEV